MSSSFILVYSVMPEYIEIPAKIEDPEGPGLTELPETFTFPAFSGLPLQAYP